MRHTKGGCIGDPLEQVQRDSQFFATVCCSHIMAERKIEPAIRNQKAHAAWKIIPRFHLSRRKSRQAQGHYFSQTVASAPQPMRRTSTGDTNAQNPHEMGLIWVLGCRDTPKPPGCTRRGPLIIK